VVNAVRAGQRCGLRLRSRPGRVHRTNRRRRRTKREHVDRNGDTDTDQGADGRDKQMEKMQRAGDTDTGTDWGTKKHK